MEVSRAKNVATYIVFPIKKTDGTNISGASGLDSEIDAWSDGGAPDGFTDCTNEATEIGSTGIYYLSLTQAETNYDYIVIQIKSSSTGAVPQIIVINTKDKTLADAVKAKTDNLPADPADDSDIDSQLATIAGYLDTEIAAIKAKTDNLPASPAAVGSAMTLAADQAVNVTKWLGATAPAMSGDAFARLGAPAGASVSADILAIKNYVDDLETRLTATRAGYLDTINDLVNGGRLDLLIDAIKAKTDNLPASPAAVGSAMTLAADQAVNVTKWKGATAPDMTGDAFARLGAPAGASVSADIAAAKGVIDAAKAVTDKLNTALELDGAVYRLTTNALEQGPGGETDLSGVIAKIDNILTAFELDGSVYRLTTNALENAPTGEGMAEMAAILAKVETMLAAGEGTDWKWTAESLIDSPVGTGGFTAADRTKLYALVTQIDENRAASAFSYSDESTDPIHKLRRMIGDTDSSDILLTDGELTIIWADNQVFSTEKENLNLCAAVACEEIASAFARQAVKAVGDLQGQTLTQKSENYRKQARLFRQRDDAGEDTTGSSGPGFCSSVTTNAPRFGRRSRRCP